VCNETPFRQSAVVTLLDEHRPGLRPIFVPHCQYICHLIAPLLRTEIVRAQTPLHICKKVQNLRKQILDFCGPSGEIRTPGILNPNRVIIIFLTFLSPFSGLCSERSCFPELFAPLFPGVRILSMVKNVVKSKHSPKGIAFRGVLSSSAVS